MRHNLIASFIAALGVLGCGSGSAAPGEAPDGGPKPNEPPKTPVTSCTVTVDTALGRAEGTSPAIAYANGRFAVAWTDLEKGAGDIVLSLTDTKGRPVSEYRLAEKTEAEVSPAIAALPEGGFLVVWEELGTPAGTLRAVRTNPEGKPEGMPFMVATQVGPEAHPNVAATEHGALLGWTEATGAVVAEAEGDRIGAKTAIDGAQQVSVAGTGAGAGGVALWSAGQRVGFMPVSLPAQAAAKAPTLFRDAPGRANLPRAAVGPDRNIAAVWEDTRGGPDREAVFFARIAENGGVSREIQVSPAGGSANYPDVAWIGSRAAVAYYQYRDGPPSIYLALVDPERGLTGKELLVSGRTPSRFPRIAWGGGDTLGVTYAARSGPARIAIVTCH